MKTTEIYIQGMHCRSCEMLIEDEIKAIPGVKTVYVNHKKGLAVIKYNGNINQREFEKAVNKAGYSASCDVNFSNKPLPWFSTNLNDYIYFGLTVMIFFVVYLLLRLTSADKLLNFGSNNFSSLPVVFLVGLTAGISTCMALVGGLVLGVAGGFAKEHPEATTAQKFKPHLFFNLGRIISFFIFGAVFGLLGSAFQLSTSFTGLIAIFAGLVMLFMGVQLTQISPRLSEYSLTLPKDIARHLGIDDAKSKEYSNKNAAILGAMTFFLPCGFTQAVQLFAISTGNPLTAALTLGTFALGTAPGLLGIGGFTAALKGSVGSFLYKLTGVVVIAMAIFNISNGVNLSGLKNINIAVSNESTTLNAKDKNFTNDSIGANKNTEAAVIKATYTVKDDIQPSNFNVKAGQTYKLEITAKEDGVGCMGSLYIAGLMKRPAMFIKGETSVIEFTPKAKGQQYTIACAMGVPRGTITVE
jgi:sulfite exporter TauE/SafE/copper chaperone CopZ